MEFLYSYANYSTAWLNFNSTRGYIMKKKLLVLIFAGIFVSSAIAAKPEWAGKGKPTDEQKAAHQAAMEAKKDLDDEAKEKKKDLEGEAKEKKEKKEKVKGLEKKKAKKSEQVQKEIDKGSEKGKEARASNSKKWWKFWGE